VDDLIRIAGGIWMHVDRFTIGGIGALVSWLTFKRKQLLKEGVIGKYDLLKFLFVGGLIAQFTSKWIAGKLGVAPEDSGMVIFLVGAFGGALFTAVMKAIDDADIWILIKKILLSKFGVKDDSTGNEPNV